MDVALRQLRESLARAGVLPLMKSKSRLFAHYTKTQKRRLKSATARKLQAKRARRAARREELGSSEEIVVNTIAQSVPSLTKAALLHLRATLRSRRSSPSSSAAQAKVREVMVAAV